MEQFLKALNRENDFRSYIRWSFPGFNGEKINSTYLMDPT